MGAGHDHGTRALHGGARHLGPLRWAIGLLTVFSQAIQITLVGVGLVGFFILFGFLTIPEATAAPTDAAGTPDVIEGRKGQTAAEQTCANAFGD